MKTVSYVITLFNKEMYLPYLLAGLKAQKGPFEKQYVFVDDGSWDKTVELLRKITADWQNVIIVEQKNMGPAGALNRALAEATGDYIKTLDGDDILVPQATSILLKALERSGCDAVRAENRLQGNYSHDRSPEEILRSCPLLPDEEPEIEPNFLGKSIESSQTNTSAWLIKREALDRFGRKCDEAIFIQDYSFELRIAACSKVARLTSVLILMPTETTGRMSLNGGQTLHDVNLALIRFLRAHPEFKRAQIKRGIKRAAARAWKWARRENKTGFLSKEFAFYVGASLGLFHPTANIEAAACAPFYKSGPIRRP